MKSPWTRTINHRGLIVFNEQELKSWTRTCIRLTYLNCKGKIIRGGGKHPHPIYIRQKYPNRNKVKICGEKWLEHVNTCQKCKVYVYLTNIKFFCKYRNSRIKVNKWNKLGRSWKKHNHKMLTGKLFSWHKISTVLLNKSSLEKAVVFVNEQNISKSKIFLWTIVSFRNISKRWTNKLDCSEV